MSVYELGVVAVPLIALSLLLDPRPAQPAPSSPTWVVISNVVAIVFGGAAVLLSAAVLTGVVVAHETVELMVEVTLASSMILLCLFTVHQMLQPVTRTRPKGVGHQIFTGTIAVATLCILAVLTAP